MANGWRSNYAIQVYRLMATPYIRIEQGSAKLQFFGDKINKTTFSGTTAVTYEYQRAAFWVLEEEIIPLT